MTRPTNLADWLAYLETLHPKAIAMGLERVREVFGRMAVVLGCPVVTVTGTNGKGSTCAFIATILRAAGYRVGLYTSPHLLRYNERVQIDGEPVSDDDLLAAFSSVEDARTAAGPDATGAIPLTYFEFGTLAALHLFAGARLDAVVLEVGLGGRLDAVNVIDAEVAVITSIDLDHLDYLGATREDVGREKAGIMRTGRPAVCGEPDPPASLLEYAVRIDARLLLIGRDFRYLPEPKQWRYDGPGGSRYGLPIPSLRGAYQLGNAATALCTLDTLRDRLPVSGGAIRDGLQLVNLPGRLQVLPGRPRIVLDVAHNPHAARALAAGLSDMGFHPQTLAVLGMLADKDIGGVVGAVKARIDRWFVAPLPGPRGADVERLRTELISAGVLPNAIQTAVDVAAALHAALSAASEADRIVAFGSFLTVAAALCAQRAMRPPGTLVPSHG